MVEGFAVVVCNIYVREEPVGAPNSFYLVNTRSGWLFLPNPVRFWSRLNQTYIQEKEGVWEELEDASRSLENKANVVEAKRREQLEK